jgi:hypothetical protein
MFCIISKSYLKALFHSLEEINNYAKSLLILARKRRYNITICDYCQCHKCKWIESNPRKLPDHCYRKRKIKIAERYIPKDEFNARIKVARKVAKYFPEDKEWRLSLDIGKNLNWKELADIFEEINSWSEENDFSLSKYVDYNV